MDSAHVHYVVSITLRQARGGQIGAYCDCIENNLLLTDVFGKQQVKHDLTTVLHAVKETGFDGIRAVEFLCNGDGVASTELSELMTQIVGLTYIIHTIYAIHIGKDVLTRV